MGYQPRGQVPKLSAMVRILIWSREFWTLEGGGEGDPRAPIATTGRPEVDDGLRRSVTRGSHSGRESKRTG